LIAQREKNLLIIEVKKRKRRPHYQRGRRFCYSIGKAASIDGVD